MNYTQMQCGSLARVLSNYSTYLFAILLEIIDINTPDIFDSIVV